MFWLFFCVEDVCDWCEDYCVYVFYVDGVVFLEYVVFYGFGEWVDVLVFGYCWYDVEVVVYYEGWFVLIFVWDLCYDVCVVWDWFVVFDFEVEILEIGVDVFGGFMFVFCVVFVEVWGVEVDEVVCDVGDFWEGGIGYVF